MTDTRVIDIHPNVLERLVLRVTRQHARGHRAMYVPIAANSPGRLYAGRGLLVGWSVRNNGANPGTLDFWDGEINNGQMLGTVALAAGASDTHSIAPHGVEFKGTVTIAVTGSTFLGSLWIIPPTNYPED